MKADATSGATTTVSFWGLAILLGFFLFAASAPSPLYGIYAKLWALSPTTVTTVYAVYAAGALTALLTTGRLSDHLGRRPVVMIALLIQAAGMFAFVFANGVAWLYVGRVLQGAGTGVATGAISAWLVDLQPRDNPRRGSVATGVALLAGLGAGAQGAGLLVEYAPNPMELVFWLLIGVYVIGLVLIPFLPDVAQRGPGWLQSMRPQVGVPSVARTPFAVSAPSLIAMWALAALYLSLGPALFASLAGSENHAVGVLIIGTLMGFGAVTSVLVSEFEPRLLVIRGSLIVVLGVGISLIAIVAESSAGLLVGSAVAGLGLGPAFSGVVRSLGPLAPPEKRGAMFAALYIVIYVSISVPAIIAGIAASRYSLITTTYFFGLVVMVLASITTLAVSRRMQQLE
jgi:predicted MFS family arabinose efflux permease